MKRLLLLLIVIVSIACACENNNTDKQGIRNDDFLVKGLNSAAEQLHGAVAHYQDLTKFPRSSNPDGTPILVDGKNWVSGFFPGNLWMMYKLQGDEKWKDAAIKWTEALNEQQYNTGTHDVGFVINCSYGNGLKLTKNDKYAPVIIQAARSLMTRYNPTVGCTKSWDWSNEWQFPVIIDNIMNMELLFEASKLIGDESFKKAAIHHAKTTMKNHYRPDNSSYHVVDYNPETGEVLKKFTHQGSSDSSAWARGQAWGLYGYTMCYRETGDQEFLDQAEKIASFIMNNPNTPQDLIPYWDYDAPGIPDEPRDASAAAIISSALLELSEYSPDNGDKYYNYAVIILRNLSSDEYLASGGSNNYFILKHSTGHKPKDSEIDAPLVYGDYYYLEALLRYKELQTKKE